MAGSEGTEVSAEEAEKRRENQTHSSLRSSASSAVCILGNYLDSFSNSSMSCATHFGLRKLRL
jgi:hypothetical protein